MVKGTLITATEFGSSALSTFSGAPLQVAGSGFARQPIASAAVIGSVTGLLWSTMSS
ncbi:Uncharacterised protein [Mycobacteroides abscessus subsp. abscessus]|nr:Uncharacterised protein [Mycobacteroides abscessus subsp. abscessus]